jgi:hypothetical protein
MRDTHEPSSHSGSVKLPPPLTAGIHDFFPPAAGLAENFLVAMATTRLTFLTPNDTAGLTLKAGDVLTNAAVDTAVICNALLATAIELSRALTLPSSL